MTSMQHLQLEGISKSCLYFSRGVCNLSPSSPEPNYGNCI